MAQRLQWLILMVWLVGSSSLFSQPLFHDDFSYYPAGTDGSNTWTPVKGLWVMQNKCYRQLQDAYDNAALASVFLDAGFRLTVRFRFLSKNFGAGVFFNCASSKSTAFSQMFRFDGQGAVILGYFRNGEFNPTRTVSLASVQKEAEHVFQLTVLPDSGLYTLFLDGKCLVSQEPLVYRSGFFGLEASNGPVAFEAVRVDKIQGSGKNPLLNWPVSVSFTPSGKLLVLEGAERAVAKIDPNGRKKIRLRGPHFFRAPVTVLPVGEKAFAVLDTATRRLWAFSDSGEKRRVIFGSPQTPWKRPVSAAETRAGTIWVLDAGRRALYRSDTTLSRWAKFPLGRRVRSPKIVAARDSLTAVFDAADRSVALFQVTASNLRFLRKIPLGLANLRGLALASQALDASFGTKVFQFDFQGNEIAELKDDRLPLFFAEGLTLAPNGEVCVANFADGTVLFLNKDLTFPKPEFRFRGKTGIELFWKTSVPIRAKVRILKGKKIWAEKTEKCQTTTHRFPFRGLKRDEIDAFQISPPAPVYPSVTEWSLRRAFATSVPHGKKRVERLPAVTVIFANVLDDRSDTSRWPALPPLPDSTVKWLEGQILDGVRFYWVHSHTTFWIDMDFVVVRKKMKRSEVFGPESYYPPKEDLLRKVLKRAGKSLNRYRGVVYLSCTRAYDSKTGRFRLVGRGGAFTEGISANNRYGISWWDVTHPGHSSENNWLFTHEFNHQTDDLFLTSGHPEYWFNHFSPSLGNVARFGEHFDGNAYFMNRVSPFDWLDLKWGDRVWTRDQDGDGIPDADARFPFDEKRLGSSPRRTDTDGDGVKDADELLFSNWIVDGVGETYGAPARFPNLNRQDTDNDGLSDGADPLPLTPVADFWRLKTDENEAASPWAQLNDPRVEAKIWVSVDSSRWQWRIQMNRNLPLKLQVDACNNGWFLGQDNLIFKVSETKSGEIRKRCVLLNASRFDRWPYNDNRLTRCVRWKARLVQKGGPWIWEVTIFPEPAVGLQFFPGKTLAVNLGFRTSRDWQGRERYVTLFEPNRLIPVRLKLK